MTFISRVATVVVCFVLSAPAHASIITTWTFETDPPADLSNSTTIIGILADVGTGTASGLHASAATDWSTPVGNGSANSLSSNTWAVNDYYQFSLSTVGFENIMLAWDQTSSATGPGEFTLAYQINGGGFTNFLDYTVLPNQAGAPGLGTWTAGTNIPDYGFTANFTLASALDNAATVDFRLIMRTTADATPPGAVAAAGTNRVDNFGVSGDAISSVPEPAGVMLFGIGALGLVAGAIRRRSRRG